MATKIKIEVLGFTGFYQGIWDQSENEYTEIRQMKYGEHEDFESLQLLDDWGFGKDYRDNVCKLFCREYVDMVNSILGLNVKLVGTSVWSPKEYNFETDEFYAAVEVEDYDAMVKKLNDIASDPRYRTDLAKIIRKRHSSYDGFMSFMSNDIEDWLALIIDPDRQTYVSYMIGYLMHLIDPDTFDNLNERMREYVECNTDYHCVQPLTDEAKEEWELYLQYRDLYTEFTRSNPKENAIGWDDYKERFLEYAEEHNQRKAWLAAQLVIPGFDE